MKILHTADWHIGLRSWKTSKEVDRNPEILEMIETMLSHAEKELVDLVVVAGDVLHEWRHPSVSSIDAAVDFLLRFSKIAPVVVILGNHDWRGLLTYRRFTSHDILILGQDPSSLTPHTIDTNSGKVVVYALPYISGAMGFLEGMEKVEDAIHALMLRYSKDRTEGDFRLMVAHVMMEGMLRPSVEDRMNLLLKPQHIPTNMDYVALGHVHEKKMILPNPPTFYSGSPIQTDFSDISEKGFLIYGNGKVEFIPLPHKRLSTLKLQHLDDIKEVIENIEMALEEYDYLKVFINEDLSHHIGKLREKEGVIEIAVTGKEKLKETYRESKSFEDVFVEYIKMNLTGKRLKKALKILEQIMEKGEKA